MSKNNLDKPEVISNDLIYKGKVFEVIKSKISEDENEYEREIIIHNGSAVIVPVSNENEIILVRQYRHAAKKFLLEIPAGSVEIGETPEICAFREIEEEIGMKAGKMEKLTEFYVSPGFLTERMYVYLATDLTETKQNLDEDEIISIVKLSFEDAFEKIRNNEIEDAKTTIGLIFAGKRFGFEI
jgi:ADP-ribose pyrophosphatase